MDIQCVAKRVDYDALLRIGRELLLAIGEDPEREGLQDTPRRWADWWCEYINYEPGKTETCFSSSTEGQLVCVSNIRAWTMCEHHLLPFWCDVSIGYIPHHKVLGLSKFARITQQFAHQLQIQEHMGQQIADEVCRIAGTEDVIVFLRGEHLCTMMRGIRTPCMMTTTIARGNFENTPEMRQEFSRCVAMNNRGL
jgi:GTP cyclohydrolase IA